MGDKRIDLQAPWHPKQPELTPTVTTEDFAKGSQKPLPRASDGSIDYRALGLGPQCPIIIGNNGKTYEPYYTADGNVAYRVMPPKKLPHLPGENTFFWVLLGIAIGVTIASCIIGVLVTGMGG